jgi:hypothetical protein
VAGTAFGTARLVELALSADDALLFRSVRPFHHRCNTKSELADIVGFFFNFSHLRPLYAALIHSCFSCFLPFSLIR